MLAVRADVGPLACVDHAVVLEGLPLLEPLGVDSIHFQHTLQQSLFI